MTHLSVENMNGVGRLMAPRISRSRPLSLDDVLQPDSNPISEDDLGLDPKGLSPNYAPWWTQPPLKPGEVTTQRGTPTPGETRNAYSADQPSFPMTPNNDARDLPNSYTGKPLRQFPRETYPTDFPHTWIAYEDLQNATGPEMGPTPPGWAPTPSEAQMQARVFDGGAPVPWVGEDQMTHDISGFSSLHDMGAVRVGVSPAMHRRALLAIAHHINMARSQGGGLLKGLLGLGQVPGLVTDETLAAQIAADASGQAAATAVAQPAAQAQASGASPSTITQILQVGAAAAAVALGATKPPAAPTTGSAPGAGAVIGFGAAGLLAAMLFAGKKGKRRR